MLLHPLELGWRPTVCVPVGWQERYCSPGQGPWRQAQPFSPPYSFCYTNKSSYIGINILSLQCFPSSVTFPEDRQRQWVPGPLRGGGLWSLCPSCGQCPTSMSPSSLSAPKPEKVMGWQVRSRRLMRQAVCVALKSGTVTSSTRCPSFPANTGGCQTEENPAAPGAGSQPLQGSGCAVRLTLEQLGLEVGRIATEVNVRALSEDKRVRFVEWVTAWGRWQLGGGSP